MTTKSSFPKPPFHDLMVRTDMAFDVLVCVFIVLASMTLTFITTIGHDIVCCLMVWP